MATYSSSSLTLRALLKGAVNRAGIRASARRLTGLTPPARALAAAAFAAERSPVFVITATDAELETAVADARFFLGALTGLSDDELERTVLPYPSLEVDPYRGMSPHLDVVSARALALHALASNTARIVIASARALPPRVSPPAQLLAAGFDLHAGSEIDPADLAARLADAGFTPEDPVDQHGEFFRRGGVLDVFPAADAEPARIEFVGDTIESIRRYDPGTQRSTGEIDRLVIVPLRDVLPRPGSDGTEADADRSATIFDYLINAHLVAVEPSDVNIQGRAHAEQIAASYAEAQQRGRIAPPPSELVVSWDDVLARLKGATALEQLAIDEDEAAPAGHVSCQPIAEFQGRIPDWVEELKKSRERGDTTVFVAATPGRAERTLELLADYEILAESIDGAEQTRHASVLVGVGALSKGFRLPSAGVQLYAETDVFDEERRVHERRKSASRTFLSDFRDLKIGDLVVHVEHGIGRFVGLKKMEVGHEPVEFMELRYAGDDKLFVPVERLDLVQKYTGGAHPSLDRLGGATWEKAKTRVRKAMRDMAEELLKLYAQRKAVPGHAFAPDSHWQEEFNDAFEYDLTPDQISAIADITRDMESPSPMDRLLCGDVGYGKTEVAMRAAFKAVMDGKQAAFLAPTTVLASQHLKTLRERFAGFPVGIDMVSRFRSKQEQKATLAALADGKVDIIVGTHRLLSKDVVFRDLGLLVVDEEQRFGVTHKEKIKQMRKKVDVLTMTATPIPRTLNMSLVGIRDMSVIETPPRDRMAIQTQVVKFDQPVIARAIRNELERGGQVYFVHNRVESIFSIASLITRLVPEARVGVGHGQMDDDDLEKVMLDFVTRKHDVLVSTTIIENGLDIPNANTMIVNRADRYGLAQLYQLRGRVGRSDRRAYAYLLIPPEELLSAVARKRLAAIREFSDLGSGFRIAALDLEIRGAGNLLGGEQSGHIEAVGFDMYMKLLEEAVRELKGEDIEDDRRAAINLNIDLKIDEAYIPDMNQRLAIYRRFASARDLGTLDRLLDEVRDRYGAPPPSILNLAEYGRLRVTAERLGVESIEREGAALVLRFRNDSRLEPPQILRLVQTRGDLKLIPPGILRLEPQPAPRPAQAPARPAGAGERPSSVPAASTARPGQVRRTAKPLEDTSASWWTSRATAGAVTPGFSRGEILKPAAVDPRAPGGIFERVSALLADLSTAAGLV
ncbi:MAG TPA: transcription-repair coupling factor [Vicinamibacterales bacterium]|nr:transcription-repair coupling factor [Vicinamibacterales bacterium]